LNDRRGPAEAPGFFRRHWSLFKNWLTFVVILGVFVAVDQRFYVWVNTVLVEWTTQLTAWTTSLLGLSGQAHGRYLHTKICSMEIIGECTAYYPVGIFVAAVCAFPARFTRKLVGIGLGVPAVLVVNQFRLISLCYVAHWIPQHFETLHVVVWQSLIVILTVVLWLIWATTLAGGGENRAV
jgi:archaeosortase B (VPXXXP-CTERM-specific)